MVTPSEVLLALFNPEERCCIRVFEDRKTGSFPGQKYEIPAGQFSAINEMLTEHNGKNRGIFFVVNYGGQDDASITRINAQFVEMDDKSFEEQEALVNAFPLPPSMIIKTKKSLHVYWFVRNAEVTRFRSIQKQLIKHFGGDPACVNESRVMRLPGFYHTKAEPVMVECISFHPERLYTQDELAEALPEVKKQPVRESSGNEPGLSAVTEGCEFIRYCRENAEHLPEPLWFAMISNLALFEGGSEAVHLLSSPYHGYSRRETQQKINNALKTGATPVTCATISDYGFTCPRMESGECKCKSPAALRFRPMSVEVLFSELQRQPKTGNIVKDVQTAMLFVRNRLYNQDPATAETFINYEVKGYFNLKTADTKLLVGQYRDRHKKWSDSPDYKRNEAVEDIPPWYELVNTALRFMPGILAEHMKENCNVIYSAEQHYIYRSGVYVPMTELEAQRMVKEKMLTRDARMNQIIDAEHQWRLLIQRDIRQLNPNHYLINLRNGYYNVLEEQLEPHSPAYYSTIQLNANYNPEAKCPRFLQFLSELTEGDEGQIGLIQEMLGYFLIPVNSAQKCFVIVGAAGAGKSVLLRVLNEILLGRENVSNVSWQALNERFKTAELFGKLANIFADLPTQSMSDSGIFKAVVGEDFLTVERKNKNPFSFQSTARLLFSCNAIPKNYGDRSEGFYRRLIIIRCNRPVPVEKRDPDLLEKLMSETDGIMAFAIEGLKRLMANNYVFSETEVNRAELQKYREESDSVLLFCKECCEFGEDFEVGSTELYTAYKAYADECGLKPFSQRSVVQQITATYPEIKNGRDSLGSKRTLKGLKLQQILH